MFRKKTGIILLAGMMCLLSAAGMTVSAEKNGIALSNDLMDAFLEEEETEKQTPGDIAISQLLLDALNEEDYRETCEKVDYEMLVRHARRMNGQPITLNVTITKIAEDQLLAKRTEKGKEYTFFLQDEREEKEERKEGDCVDVYGEYAGIINAGTKDIPAIRVKYMDEAKEEEETEIEIAKETTKEEKNQSQSDSKKYKTLYCVNCNEYITLRSYPSKAASALDRIPFGDSVSYVGKAENGFYEVIYNGTRGYALASYLDTSPQKKTSSGGGNYTTLYCINCNEYITLRSYPSTSASALAYIPLGASVSYVGKASNGFYEVIYNGTRGYALASYLGTSRQKSSGGSYSTKYVINCNEYITLRSYPSTSASALAHIPLGASVSYVGGASNGFCEVIYNGTRGYALSSYLGNSRQSSGTGYSTMYVINCSEYITLRSYPSASASALAYIPLGASVSYVGGASNGFYEVIYNGTRGYALASYLGYSRQSSRSYTTLRVVNCSEYITLRSYASTSASALAYIPLGATVSYVGNAGNGFYEVIYNGTRGYALASYLS